MRRRRAVGAGPEDHDEILDLARHPPRLVRRHWGADEVVVGYDSGGLFYRRLQLPILVDGFEEGLGSWVVVGD